jgi:iron transport multicopper oxidase
MQERNNVPQIMHNQCQDLGKPFLGNAAGHSSSTDLTGLPLGPYPQILGWHSKGIGAMAGCVIFLFCFVYTFIWTSWTDAC